MKKERNLSDLTNEELDDVVKIVNLNKIFNLNMVKKKEKNKILLESPDYSLVRMIITPEGILSSLGPDYKFSGTENPFRVAQYLIDKGFRFNYDN